MVAAQQDASSESAAALETLCSAYWYPLYAYVRRAGHTPHDAQDLTQEFFARLLAKEWLDSATPKNGRFRSFLLIAMKRFLAKEWHRERTQKRGGRFTFVPLDPDGAEQRYAAEPALEPEAIYDRRWALTLLEDALERLRAEFVNGGRAADYEVLKPWLTAARGEIPYRDVAAQLGSSEGAARVTVHRMRKRFREHFREAIAETVTDASEVPDELLHLARVLGHAE